jgi:hypothetical protein
MLSSGKMNQQSQHSSAELPFSILVTEFCRENCPFSVLDRTWKQFHTFRNAVLDILAPYGTFGPRGKMPILDTYEESEEEWSWGARNPDFYVVDVDMYGCSVRVEANWSIAKPALLEELAMLLSQCQEWSVYLALIKGGLWVFHDRILFEGTFFAGCTIVEDLYTRCALPTDTVAPPPAK